METFLAPRFQALLQKCSRLGLLNKLAASARVLIVEERALRDAKKKGRTRGTSRGSKRKGAEGVAAARAWLLGLFFDLQPDDILVQTTSVGGSDLHFSPLAARLFPFAPESKRVQSLNVWGALHQAEANAKKKGLKPVLFFARNNSPLYVAFKAEDLHAWLHAGHMPNVREPHQGDTDADGPGSSDQVTPEAG